MIDGDRIVQTISERDGMYSGHRDHYFAVGTSALAVIEAARSLAGGPAPRRILDLPCGHGRVTRTLRAAWPEAEITACDIDRDGVDFCRDTFGCTPVYGDADFARVTFPEPFDLIWVGSLVTHLPEARTRDFLGWAAGLLREGGMLVVTFHGRFVAGRIDAVPYGVDAERVPGMVADWAAAGYGYADYPNQDGYGISLIRPEWMIGRLAELGLSVLLLSERRWDHHHDVVAAGRAAP